MLSVLDVVINASGGVALAFGGTYLLNLLIRAPRLLDEDWQSKTVALGAQLSAAQSGLESPQHVREISRRMLVAEKLADFSEPEKGVMRRLIQLGRAKTSDISHWGFANNAAHTATSKGDQRGLLIRRDPSPKEIAQSAWYEVNPDLLEALTHHLLT